MKIFILSLAFSLFSLETMALSCDHTNYRDYIRNSELTSKLIKETGAGCNLTKAHLLGAKLKETDLRRADLYEVNLYDADLRNADLEGADLRKVNLWISSLGGANLRGVDLRGAKLQGAYLQLTDLQGADLRNADFAGVFCPRARFENAIYNDETDFPGQDSLFIKKHNMIKKR